MAVEFDIVIGDVVDVAMAYDRIMVFRASSEAGAFTEITTALTRIPIEPTDSIYRFRDDAGVVTDWYRVAYWSTTRTEASAQGPPFLGELDPALELIPVPVFKERYLIGLDLTLEDGSPFPDTVWQHYIKAAYARTEMLLGIPLSRLSVVETHDWNSRMWSQWGRLVLNKVPIISIESIKLSFPGANTVLDVPAEWMSSRGGRSRTVQIKPAGGISSFFASGGAYWMKAYHQQDYVPNAFEVRYTAGFQRGRVPANIIEVVGKIASFGPLNILGDLVAGAGLQAWSLGLDGLSTSVTTANSSTNAGFGARLINYGKELKEEIRVIRDYYHGGDLQAG